MIRTLPPLAVGQIWTPQWRVLGKSRRLNVQAGAKHVPDNYHLLGIRTLTTRICSQHHSDHGSGGRRLR